MITFIIIAATVLISIPGFSRPQVVDKLKLDPYMMVHKGQWYRFITHGFVHADYIHLLVNMLVLWSFAQAVIYLFAAQYQAGVGMAPTARFCLLYFGGLIIASVYDVIKRRNNPFYGAIGASGAVSAVVFTSIFYQPLGKIYLMGVLPLPSIIFGLLYVGYEYYSARKSGGNVNHNAHLAGAIYGFLFPVITGTPFTHFINSIGL